ncbi:alpha-mannosidase [Lederbergia lenta]|uniref:Alpha-mannosidase n=1 Tax=Lederbergia lenta TaxID=1467 RepID=A0A2X4WBK6_LEDLE|nr:alpha-mannosidase [Lederbergia lenta]MEC2322944.1 alpha-mannosidase [Lederbergia lenta]SQI62087.1 alpha-mannosidase [Lederbergia lenta]
MSKTTAHIISHSHWDREWYLPFEKHRYYLVKLMDDLLEKLESDPEYKSFHLDGQTIAVDDYLEIKPEKRELLKKYIEENKIIIGPWYILQDAFLTSAEANVRNLIIGMHDAEKFGSFSKLGYFPDTFGVYGQAPQMLQQAGISTATFGRGVKPTGFNNMVSDSVNFESPFSELEWQSPDGSSVLGILLANWYSNGNEVPTSEEEAKQFWEQKLADARKYASTPHLLYMNGCDHQPLQKDLPEAIRMAKDLYPEIDFVHSNFADYMEAVQKNLPENLQTVQGELRNQRTDGWSTLVNTASARIYLKQMNHLCQIKLERLAEPLSTFAYMLGEEYPEDYLRFAWKQLMQNHPHDSICGCSVDEVHEEMVTRFKKVDQMTDMIIQEQIEKLTNKIEINAPAGYSHAKPLVVFNTVGHERHTVIEKVIDYERVYFRDMSFTKIPDYLKGKVLPELAIVNASGEVQAASIEDAGVEFGYDLPDDAFRQPYFARKLKLTFATDKLPAMGYQTYFLVEKQEATEEVLMIKNDRVIENNHLKISVHSNGSYDIEHKGSGKTYYHVGGYENTSDIGNEYMFKKGTNEKPYTTSALKANIQILENNAARAMMEITHKWEIPVSAAAELEDMKDRLVWHRDREAGRSEKMTTLVLKTILTLGKESEGLAVKVTIDNTAKDHRLRVLYPTSLQTDHHLAESAFEIVQRPNKPEVEWENPSFDHHQQSFASLSDGEFGLTVATKGLHEYEVLEDQTTLAVTVLRSVSELGDWGYFPTPEAQCLGTQTAEWFVIPHEGNAIEAKVYEQAYDFQTPVVCRQAEIKAGSIPTNNSFINWNSDGLVFTSLKMGEKQDDIIMRFYNPADAEKYLSIESPHIADYYTSNIIEEKLDKVGETYANIPVSKYKIMTVAMEGRK